MSDLPKAVRITEEGPREGFQIEKGPIPTARKIALIDALSQTGLDHIQIVSFVNPKAVPGMADADDVVDGIKSKPDVAYTALWLNEKGFERALQFSDRLAITGTIQLVGVGKILACAIRTAPRRSNSPEQHAIVENYKAAGVPVERGSIMAAFGCNFEGDIPVVARRGAGPANSRRGGRARRHAQIHLARRYHGLGDSACHQARCRHFARALARARLRAASARHPRHGDRQCLCRLEMGVRRFDAAVAGLGGCPFAGHQGAAGNVCTEDLVFICNELGIETGIDLDALIECARLAEDVVGHPLPGSVMKGGTLERFRR